MTVALRCYWKYFSVFGVLALLPLQSTWAETEVAPMTFSQPSRTVASGTKVMNVNKNRTTTTSNPSVLFSNNAATLRSVKVGTLRAPGSKADTLEVSNGSGVSNSRLSDVTAPMVMVKISDDGGTYSCGEFQVTGATCSGGDPCTVHEQRASTGPNPCDPPQFGYQYPGTGTGDSATGSGTYDLSSGLSGKDRCMRVKQGDRMSELVLFEGC